MEFITNVEYCPQCNHFENNIWCYEFIIPPLYFEFDILYRLSQIDYRSGKDNANNLDVQVRLPPATGWKD